MINLEALKNSVINIEPIKTEYTEEELAELTRQAQRIFTLNTEEITRDDLRLLVQYRRAVRDVTFVNSVKPKTEKTSKKPATTKKVVSKRTVNVKLNLEDLLKS